MASDDTETEFIGRSRGAGWARPSTWRVVEARPVDILVWDPVEPAGGTEIPQPAPSADRNQDEEPAKLEARRGVH